jgi:hypothetical protein
MQTTDVELPPAQQKFVPRIDENDAAAVAQAACRYANKAMSLFVLPFPTLRSMPPRSAHMSHRYQCATDGSSVAISAAMAMLLYVTARIFLYLSITRIAYIVFLWISLRPLARKYFSKQIDTFNDVAARFINAIVDAPFSGISKPAPPAQEQGAAAKKEM